MPILKGYFDPDKTYDYTYLSLGAGVQSSALLLMSNLGLHNCPKADVSFFADTQSEPYWVYEQLELLKKLSDIEVRVVTAGDLGQQYIDGAVHKKARFFTLPVHTLNEETGSKGMTPRSCTWEAKVMPQERGMRAFMGFKKGERIAGKKNVLSIMGISWDESQRVKPNKTPWIDNDFPLVNERITREGCVQLLKEHGWPVPRKSACTFCSFRADPAWRYLKENEPEVFKEACEFDKAIRDQSKSGLVSKAYLHKSCIPLEDVDFTKGGQLEFGFMGCDEGHCGV